MTYVVKEKRVTCGQVRGVGACRATDYERVQEVQAAEAQDINEGYKGSESEF